MTQPAARPHQDFSDRSQYDALMEVVRNRLDDGDPCLLHTTATQCGRLLERFVHSRFNNPRSVDPVVLDNCSWYHHTSATGGKFHWAFFGTYRVHGLSCRPERRRHVATLKSTIHSETVVPILEEILKKSGELAIPAKTTDFVAFDRKTHPFG